MYVRTNSQLARDFLLLATLCERCAMFRVFFGPYFPVFILYAGKYKLEKSPNSVICLTVTKEVRKGKLHFLYNVKKKTFLFCNFLYLYSYSKKKKQTKLPPFSKPKLKSSKTVLRRYSIVFNLGFKER